MDTTTNMHPFLSRFHPDDLERALIIDAISERKTEEDDTVIVCRCANLFSDRGRNTAVLFCDGTAQWRISNGPELVTLYRQKEISMVVAFPNEVLEKYFPTL